MKRIWLGTLLAVFVLALSASVASAATGSELGSTTVAVHTFNMESSAGLQAAGHTATFLIAIFYPSNQAEKEKDDFKGKDKGRGNDDKRRFHGAEMSSGAILIAGLLAITAYFLFVRRKSHTRA